MVTIRDADLIRVAGSVRPDNKKRVVLPKSLVQEDTIYHIYHTGMGQILLDPQVTIPASELWLFQNADAIASIKRGFVDAAEGRVSRINLDTL